MKILKGTIGILALALSAAFVQDSSAQTAQLQVLTAGSSAQFGPFAIGAYALANNVATTAVGHYTVKSGACPDDGTGNGTSTASTCLAYLRDTRKVGTTDIVPEPGNLWVAWSQSGTGTSAVYQVWAYLSVDSTVGVRAFQAAPRAKLTLAALASLPVSATTNYPYWNDNSNDSAMPTAVYNAINGVALTAANTDIRPEDALFATNRSLNSLGYGSVADPRSGHSGQFLIGTAISSHFGSGVAHPVSFAISGADPFSGATPPAFKTIPVGAAPIVFLANNTTGSATINGTNITLANAGILFSGTVPSGGTACQGSLVDGVSSTAALNPVLREPLSGTMNTTQYSVFDPKDQESGWTAAVSSVTCGSGARSRSIGTGDEVSAVRSQANSVGYAFFSYESTGANANYKYLKLAGVDPLYPSTHTYTGALPSCGTLGGSNYLTCPVTGGTSFPGLRNNTYKAWSIYRMVTDSTNLTNTQTLATEAQLLVNSTIPDFVPFLPQCKLTTSGTDEPGLDVYRAHYVPSTITTVPNTITVTANSGPLPANTSCTVGSSYTLKSYTLGGTDPSGTNTEQGGDAGGAIQGPFSGSTQPTVPGTTQTSTH